MQEKFVSPFQASRRNLRGWRNQRGQDLIEYALMAGFVIVCAGAIMPGVAYALDAVFTKISISVSQDDRKNTDGTCNSPAYVVRKTQCVTSAEFEKLEKWENR